MDRRFLKLCTNMAALSRSQLFQDILPLFFLGPIENGFFIEVGVGNGVTNSNTYLLEDKFQWNGILVEPNPLFHTSICENRKAVLVKHAIASKGTEKVTLNVTLNGELSFIANSYIAASPRRNIDQRFEVQSKTLNDILVENYAPTKIDFLSIDVEGFELEVLNGIDFSKYIFFVISVEHNYNSEKRAEIFRILKRHGYKQILKAASQFDSFFVFQPD